MDKKKLEGSIRSVYRSWKQQHLLNEDHPEEEIMAGFLERRLSDEEARSVKEHILHCERCSEIVSVSIGLGTCVLQQAPAELLTRAKGVPAFMRVSQLLEVVLRLRKKALEVMSCSGDLLVGQELIPAALLRSRSMNELQDEVTVLKDYEKVRIQVRIERQEPGACRVSLTVTCKQSHKCVRDIRITLMKENVELESYLAQNGSAVFEQVPPGEFVIEVSSLEEKLGAVLLEIRE